MKKLASFIVGQVRDNAVSLVLQVLMVAAIAGYAIYDINARLDKAEAAVVAYVKGELAKIESVPDDIAAISSSLALLTETTTDAVVENKDKIVEGVKAHGPAFVRDWMERRRQAREVEHGVELTEDEFDRRNDPGGK